MKYVPGCVAPFGPFGKLAQDPTPSAANITSIANATAIRRSRLNIPAIPPTISVISNIAIPPPKPAGTNPAAVVLPWQKV
jgi:hypothetical protein